MNSLQRLKNIRNKKNLEVPTIRPPNEKNSLLLRVTRGCFWNKCRFCGVYNYFKQGASFRGKTEVLEDIKKLGKDEKNLEKEAVFLGDSDPILIETSDLEEIIMRLYETFPKLKRVTSYARAVTLWSKRRDLERLKGAGLKRVHVGLETGSNYLLKYHQKGINKNRMVQSGKKTKEARIELSYYVLLGLGGRDYSKEHIKETIKVLNEVKPEFVRFRKLWIHSWCDLAKEKEKGNFKEQIPEGTVYELKEILRRINFKTTIESIHANNYVQLHGKIPEQKQEMLDKIDNFLSLPLEKRKKFYRSPGVI